MKTYFFNPLMGLMLCASASFAVDETKDSYGHEHADHGKHMTPNQASAPHPMARNLENLTDKPLEVAFLKQMIHHHQMGIDMAKLAATNTGRQELNKVGLEIIAKESQEVQAMSRWLEEWHDEKPGDMADAPHMGMMMSHQAELKQARDADFDRKFIRMMTHHHQGAIKMAKIIQDKSENEVLKTFAGKVIEEQTKEITQLENWEKEWFPEAG